VVLKKIRKITAFNLAQYAIKTILLYIGKYYHSHAALFLGSCTSQRIKILSDKKIQWKSSINPSLVFGEWANAVPLMNKVMQLLLEL